jgi:hypothetical protein
MIFQRNFAKFWINTIEFAQNDRDFTNFRQFLQNFAKFFEKFAKFHIAKFRVHSGYLLGGPTFDSRTGRPPTTL